MIQNLLLAIDTTSPSGSVALARGQEIIDLVALHSTEGYGHLIFQQIIALLGRHNLRLSDVDGYAAASGPGSFTGVRVGLTAAKGLAEAHGKLVAPVSNLKALAYTGLAGVAEGTPIAPVIDARRGEIYCAVYRSELHAVVDEFVGPVSRAADLLQSLGATLIGADRTALQRMLAGTPLAGSPVLAGPSALAGAVAGIAAKLFADGRALLPEEADANYVRRSDAELLWKEA